jgi:hypothetical protein
MLPSNLKHEINRRAHAAALVYSVQLREKWLSEIEAARKNGETFEELQKRVAALS